MNEVVASSHGALAYHGRSFHLAGRLLPVASRDDAAVCYAFCRMADDAVDEAPDADAAHAALAAVRAELAGRAEPRPLVAAWRALEARRGIPVCAARDLLDGMASDLGEVAVQNDAELLRYCYRAAGTVGLMMAAILGTSERAAAAHAVDLGVAMQLTNIARDVAEDAARGRIYLPAERLAAAGQAPGVPLDAAPVARVVTDLLAMAERFYDSGLAGLRYLPLRVRPAIGAAAFLYRGIGRALLARGADPLRGRVVLGTGARLRLALAGLVRGLLPSAPRPHDARLHLHLQDILPERACPTV